MKNLEILSPAKNFECLEFAIYYGADAVYLGGEIFGMRTTAANFNFYDLEKAVNLAHKNNVKIYLTCNSIPTNDELKNLKNFLKTAEEIGVDALIVADLGIILEIKRLKISTPLHISTQFGVMNYKTANALYELGAKRIVLARELCLKDIKTIREKTPKELELECFVHGSVCMSVSGRCLISSYLTKRDANRGECSQPCRWKYFLVEEKRPNEYFPVFEDEKASYILNCKDLCLIDHLDVLYEAGISSFKIEGRAKSLYYVSVVTNAYKKAVQILKECVKKNEKYNVQNSLKKELETVSHREYHTGFLFKNPKENGQCFKTGTAIKNYNFIAQVVEFNDKEICLKQKNFFKIGDEVELISPFEKPIKFKIEQILDENKIKIDSAFKSEMKIYIPFMSGFKIKKGSLIRKKIS